MILAHRIRLNPNAEQLAYFLRAAGTARRVWNWGLAEWLRQLAAGLKPNAYALKRQFNAIKYVDPAWLSEDGYPWLRSVHRDSHSQPFANLGRAWGRYTDDLNGGRATHPPRFKKKGRCHDSFYIANDKFRMEGLRVILPIVGPVSLCEPLRLKGKIMAGTVQREADHWYLAVQVEMADPSSTRQDTCKPVVGVDFGICSAVTLSTGETLKSPRPLRAALRRMRLRGRRLSRKLNEANCAAKIGSLPLNIRPLPVSNRRKKSARALARLHARVAAIRHDFTHKLTTRLCRENQTVVIEDLHVKGMLANRRLSSALSDIGFGSIRKQLEYKSRIYSVTLLVADRWYPSSKLCSVCGWKHASLGLSDRRWTCAQCFAIHDRDCNAAINLQRLASGAAVLHRSQTALPVASRTVTSGAGRVY
jgi:putative transposase